MERAKQIAGEAVANLVENNQVIGLGTGSTIVYAIKMLEIRIKKEKLKFLAVPTSSCTKILAIKAGIPLTSLEEYPELDIAIDGADEVDPKLNLIKGKGAALTQEKIVASAAKQFFVAIDESKLVKCLGQNYSLPIEVLPCAWRAVERKMERMNGKPVLRLISETARPVITDNGNFILDVDFGLIKNPKQLEQKLDAIPGIIETGLFVGMTTAVYVGTKKNKIKVLKK